MVEEGLTFPLVEVRGDPRECGRQHGEACREQVRQYADALLGVLGGEAALRGLDAGGVGDGADRPPGLSREALYARAMTFLPSFEAFAPHLVEEIRGIAEGAGVPFGAALLVNVRAEVAGVVTPDVRGIPTTSVEGCTAFAVGRGATLRGDLYLGQNQDQAPEMEALGIVLRVRPAHGPPAVMATFGGLVGYPGLNAAGVAHFQNALSNAVWRHALPHYPMKRALLEQSDLTGCLAVFDRARLASCGNYVLGDRSGRLLDIEATPDGYAALEPERGVVVHTNHFRSDRFRPQERLLTSLPDSTARLSRMVGLLAAGHGKITLETVKDALRDHEDLPGAICRHEPERPMKTIASIIAEPDAGRLHVARGNPCRSEYVAYDVE